ncbi:hypothetical protein BCR39DRAFT_519928 [Naematelia encephala]|uniref:CFA20 domain-containing protein n=1 Tax=Naematelia encephala TaxID=71784 RepID=A0A1Y2BF11_9TREE|nr:hypothetical protein BCR39DRAFT_519928 [Naematelia encephala]
MSLLAGTIQPPLMTLLSSTSQPSLSPLFRLHVDPKRPNGSIIRTIDDTSEDPELVPRHYERGDIVHRVIHIQSPDNRSTYIQAGCLKTQYDRYNKQDIQPLGIELGWVHLQVKRLGRREMSFEVGIVDARGREGVVRCSSFQQTPKVHAERSPPLIHLPLALPQQGPTTLTQWLDISLDLAALLPLFQSLPRRLPSSNGSSDEEDNVRAQKRRKMVELPSGRFASISCIRVYANCRVRRIWVTAEGQKTMDGMGRALKDEWGLYAAASAP